MKLLLRALNVLILVGGIAAFSALASLPATALEVLGVTVPGTVSAEERETLAYSVDFEIEEAPLGLAASLSSASLLATQKKKGAADIHALAARARADAERLFAALYAEAYYGGRLEIKIAGQSLDTLQPEQIAVTVGTPIQVTIHVKPGPLFHFGSISIEQVGGADASPLADPEDYDLVSGKPAKSEKIVAAIDRLIDEWRAAGYPFAKIADKDISADHARSNVNVRLVIASGPLAVYSQINVTGADQLDSQTIADQSGLKVGQRFNARKLKKTRERLRKLESIESVRIKEGKRIDASGGIPITLEVAERKPRFFGATTSVSTIDGAEVQAYWGHRNVFGKGERLRVDAAVSGLGDDGFDELEFDVGAFYSKPGIFYVDTDMFTELRFRRERPETYESLGAKAQIGVSHKFNSDLSGVFAFGAEQLEVKDAFGTNHNTLLSLLGEMTYDTRNSRFDPSRGMAATLRLTPTTDVADGASYLVSEAKVANYLALDRDERVVVATRLKAGSIVGASLSDVPATSRFFAGGGGSVRGYEFRSVGPRVGDRVVGGRSTVGGSAELRLRVTDLIGVVPFVDAAVVSDDSFPEFSSVFVGAGIGVRYYTSLGPLRLDVAAPLTNREDQPDVAAYVGLGQAF